MKTGIQKILIILLHFYLITGSDRNHGFIAVIKPTSGEIWPKPKFERRFENNFIDPNNFDFVSVGETCTILDEALIRYTRIIKETVKSPIIDNQMELFGTRLITKIAVNLTNLCEHLPHLEMDESYNISGAAYLTANSIWGILRALETYSQSITPTVTGILKVPNIWVIDSPRFSHRGLLLDTARHYISIDRIFTILDGMAYNKLNVFHWHIVDDQSFPYQSSTFPELSAQGAYTPSMIYTQENISKIIEYARMRGIRVVPEFDIPGHSRSWGNSHPEILTACEGYNEGRLGPMYPLNKTIFNFLQPFFSEVLQVFPDHYIHFGGDEVDFVCWYTKSIFRNYFIHSNIAYLNIQQQFMEHIMTSLVSKPFTPIVWQEVMVNDPKMPTGTVVQVWTDDWRKYLSEFTYCGHRILLSGCWYLGYDIDWETFYMCEPFDFAGTVEQKKLLIGGEACMWTELINNYNVVQTIFPRVSAVAERLWSSQDIINITDAKQRLEEHTCRMILRGVHAQPPSGPGIC